MVGGAPPPADVPMACAGPTAAGTRPGKPSGPHLWKELRRRWCETQLSRREGRELSPHEVAHVRECVAAGEPFKDPIPLKVVVRVVADMMADGELDCVREKTRWD